MNIETAQDRHRIPTLSVVSVTRNDDHGINMRGRTQHFVTGFIEQCRRHQLNAELILVEWNPPADRPPLEDTLEWPDDFGPAQVRIIRVPADVHAQFAHSESLPLFQMIGKNVGIRRARGQFVLATNVDILFDDALVRYVRGQLKPGTMLRIDRYDVPSDIATGAPFEQVLADCASRFFQVQTRYGIFDVREVRLRGMTTGLEASIMSMILGLRILGRPFREPSRKWTEAVLGHYFIAAAVLRSIVQNSVRKIVQTILRAARKLVRTGRLYARNIVPLRRLPIRTYYLIRRIIVFPIRLLGRFARDLRRLARLGKSAIVRVFRALGLARRESLAALRFRQMRWLHTNGCGDFTLLSRDDWFRLRGYAEWPIFSWHLDSLLMYAASANGIRQIVLNDNYRIYHIDHSGGWSPQRETELFSGLRTKGVPFLTNEELSRWETTFSDDPQRAILNEGTWGLSNFGLPERDIRPRGRAAA
jgi:hypothetical protein